MSECDPIYQALVQGRNRCPDGATLVRLGALLREQAAPPRENDLTARVLRACHDIGDEGALIAARYDEGSEAAGQADPGLQRLGELLREQAAPPREVDLVPEVARQLTRQKLSQRHSARLQVDSSTRWRIWTAVIGGHIAALLAILVAVDHWRSEAERRVGERQAEAAAYIRFYQTDLERYGVDAMPDLARRWRDLAEHPGMLFGLRSDPQLRRTALDHFGNAGSQGTVQAGVRWLVRGQQADGSWVAGESIRAQATTAAAVLAILADGARRDDDRAAVARGLRWLVERDHDRLLLRAGQRQGRMASGLVALALAEGAALVPAAEVSDEALRFLRDGLQADPTLLGDGFFATACATAHLYGWLEAEAFAPVVADASRPDADPGLAAVMARITGQAPPPVAELVSLMPQLDEHERIDPLAWFFPGIALREVGGKAWQTWSQRLERSVLLRFRYDGDAAWLPAEDMAHSAGDDVFATGLALLNLQLAYRYLPMAPVEVERQE